MYTETPTHQLLTQRKLFQQIKVTLKEVILDCFMQDKRHTVPTEFFICLVPAWLKSQMCCFICHDEDVFCKGGQFLWLVLSGGPVLPKRQRQRCLNCGSVLSFYIRVCVQSSAGGGGGRGGSEKCWLLALAQSNLWSVTFWNKQVLIVIKNSSRKLLSRSKSTSIPRKWL